MKVDYREWTIDSRPEKKGHIWHAWCEVERGPWEDEDQGEIYNFFDIGNYDTEAAARDRAIAWAKAWLDSNY